MKEIIRVDVSILKNFAQESQSNQIFKLRKIDFDISFNTYVAIKYNKAPDTVIADLTGVNLTKANLAGTKLIETNFTGANLNGANLAEANLAGADLINANFYNAIIIDANFNVSVL
ncbi:MAG: pentapeptide repeat-containing protein [Alphaproteobacteria bacterium]|nr:pentapeptide repeat-containing protein [Alphaproteobacteria bacterium]